MNSTVRNAFAPVSACGRGCLPRPGITVHVGLSRRCLRVVAVVLAVSCGIFVAALLPALNTYGRGRLVQLWFQGVLRAAGVRLRLVGEPVLATRPGTLVTANHVSWLDIPAILAIEPVTVLAKKEVRRWPLIGWMAYRADTVFVDRGNIRRLPQAVAQVADALRAGQNVLVFPEGSTWCGRTLGRFYPATFQAAIDARAPVRPVSLRYVLADGSLTTAAAFVGDDTLVASVLRVVATRGLTIEIAAEPLIEPPALAAAGTLRCAPRRELGLATAAAVRRTVIADVDHLAPLRAPSA
jgi:1-acyl-sn-glycerol-3-phosphate acyltransferase